MKKNSVPFLLMVMVCLFVSGVNAQQTAVYTNQQYHYQEGLRLFDQGLYGPAQEEFRKYLEKSAISTEGKHPFYERQAQMYIARCAVRDRDPQAESLVLAFIQENHPDPIATVATLEIANDYYRERQYEKAITYYNLLRHADMKPSQKAEANFKMGYCHFVRKEFDAAKVAFSEIKDARTKFYYPTNYYLGMTAFFEKDYDAALAGFERVAKSEMYASFAPYYIVQIQFAKSNYPEVISYGEKSLGIKDLQNRKEIRHLVGKSYFEQQDYAQALPHLEYYASRSGKMRAEDFYQLGFVQYKLGMCEKSASNFKELHLQETEIGQQAHYYMADCFLQNGDMTSARTAFHAVSKMDFNKAIRDEALFNYGKLSAQLHYDQEAIAALESFAANSPLYAEAQEVLKDLFVRTRDYDHAIQRLEEMGSLSPVLQEAYQKVTFSRAVQYMNDGLPAKAGKIFDKSIAQGTNRSLLAQAWFWKGEINHRAGAYDESITCYKKYFSYAAPGMRFPAEAQPGKAHYNQGYNYLKKSDYKNAYIQFEKSIDAISGKEDAIHNAGLDQNLLADALLRAGDCAFKQNKYAAALSHYQASIDQKQTGFIYASYQKAMIKGLKGEVYNKIALLEEIQSKYPENPFMGEVLFELASTYQENGHAPKAVDAFELITKRYHQNTPLVHQAYLRLGLLSYNNGDAASALKYYKAIFKQNPEPKVAKEAITAVEEIYIRDLGQPENYVAFMEEIPGYNVSEFRKDSLAFIAAETRYETGQYAEAIKGYTKYLERYGQGVNRPTALYHRAESHVILKDFGRALKDYERIIDLGKSNYYTESLRKAAKIAYNDAENFQRSLELYQQLEGVTTSEETRFEAHWGALRSAYRLGREALIPPLADRVIRHGLASEAQKSTAYFYRGKVAFSQQSYEQALGDFNEVIQRSTNIQAAEARYNIARIYYEQGAFDIAKKLCLNVNQENANYPEWVARSIVLLADIHVAQQDLFNARAALEAVIENDTGNADIIEEAKEKLAAIEAMEKEQNRIAPEADKSGQIQLIEKN